MMATARVLALAFALATVSVHAECQPVAGAETVVVHSGELELRGLLWRPRGNGPFPGVLFNHGSARPEELHRPAALGPAFARYGYVFRFLDEHMRG